MAKTKAKAAPKAAAPKKPTAVQEAVREIIASLQPANARNGVVYTLTQDQRDALVALSGE
tara:strand:+ start:5862 stop:6041 length:180 start_codon:yes stop_codon:yes gene_type:complete